MEEKNTSRLNFDLNSTLSSRIKKVYIQLHDYTYYHGPSDEYNEDKRLIGRTKVMAKIRALIENSEIASGAYLVTGYRGAGKTSIVNKVIGDISHSQKIFKNKLVTYLFVFAIYALIIYFIGLYSSDKESMIAIWKSIFIISTIILIGAGFLKYLVKDKEDMYFLTSKIGKLAQFIHLYIPMPIIKESSFNKSRSILNSINWIAFSLYPLFLVSVLAGWFNIIEPDSIIMYFSIFIVVELILNLLFNISKEGILQLDILISLRHFVFHCKEIRAKGLFSKCKWLIFYMIRYVNLKRTFDKLNHFLSNNRYVFIKLNLGYSKLSEINILKLLARNLKTELKAYQRRIYYARIMLGLAFFFLAYLCIFLFYFQENVYNYHTGLKENIHLKALLPSQNPTVLLDTNLILHNLYNTPPPILEDSLPPSLQFAPDFNISSGNINQHKTVVEYIVEVISKVAKIVVPAIDLFISSSYIILRNIILNGFLWIFNKIPPVSLPQNYVLPLKLMPDRLDYFFVIYLLLFYFILRRILYSRIFNQVTISGIMKKVNTLNDIIVSEITTEKAAINAEKGFNFFSFFSPKTKKRALADEREIEKMLIEIFDDIDRIHFPYSRPKIIVILDELDKIETLYQIGTSMDSEKKENNDPGNFIKIPNPTFSIEASRERQQTIQKLLSNLKYFLSDVKAKFIFIAGREMFDASLADISDRNYFMGSIFHEVIYINTFFSDDSDEKPTDITSLIESYVCSKIIPLKYNRRYYLEYIKEKLKDIPVEELYIPKITPEQDNFTMEIFHDYLIDNFPNLNEKAGKKTDFEKFMAKEMRQKVIHLVQQFIMYLTHASNGAPKKITNYFENFIEFKDLAELEEDRSLVISLHLPNRELNKESNDNSSNSNRKPSKLYLTEHRKPFLVFNFNAQYEIGLVNYLTVPIVYSISNHIKHYGDKILVSATYLFDHLIKFHRFGFSWRNIETVPEILEINKTPELRGFVSSVMQVLSQSHLQVLNSGLYNFRYNRRLAMEIAFLSKISEMSAAAFNFTLDESLAIKHNYFSLLHRLEERYKKITDDRTEYIHSIALIHSTLGDLYFYDEEYNDAIVEYLDAVQYLRYSDLSEEQVSLMLILVRNMLKLGLAYEKRKTYDSAFGTFTELCSLLIKYRYIDVNAIGLEEKKEGNHYYLVRNTHSRYKEVRYIGGETGNEEKRKSLSPIDLFTENFVPNLSAYDNVFSTREGFLNRLTNEINPNIQKILGKISSFEGLRLIYQPLLAKLQLMEKCILGGFTQTDVFRVEKEFEYLQKATNSKEKILTAVEFYNRLGDILFFKRGKRWIDQNKPCTIDAKPKTGIGKCPMNRFAEKNWDINSINHLSHDIKAGKLYPDMEDFGTCSACMFYLKSIYLYVNNDKDPKNEFWTPREAFLKIASDYDDALTVNSTSLRILAGLISDFADVRLSCHTGPDFSLNLTGLKKFFVTISTKDSQNSSSEKLKSFINNRNFKLDSYLGIILQYYLSALYYKRSNDFKQYTWQITKIVYLLKELAWRYKKNQLENINEVDGLLNNLSNVEDELVRRVIRGCWRAYENVHINKIYRFFDIYFNQNKARQNENKYINKYINLRKLSINSDTEECNIAYSSLKLALSRFEFENTGLAIKLTHNSDILDYMVSILNPYSLNDTKFNRLIRLKFKSDMHYIIASQILETTDWENNEQPKPEHVFKKILINLDKLFKNANIPDTQPVNTLEIGKDKTIVIDFTEFLAFLVTDSIFALSEIIQIANSFGKSYMISNFSIAESHERMMHWCYIKEALESFHATFEYKEFGYLKEFVRNLSQTIKNQLLSLIDKDTVQSVNHLYHCEMAVNRYYAAKEAHSEGNAYKNLIESMAFLNDDFNDKYSHFNIALERNILNTNEIDQRINRLKKISERSLVYRHKSYINPNKDKARIIK
jgi:hypothetical protein